MVRFSTRLKCGLLAAVLLLAGCTGTAPTPQIVYVTQAPSAPVSQPTPIVVYVTPMPTVDPTPLTTPGPTLIVGGAGAGLSTAPALRTIVGTLTFTGETLHDIDKKTCFGKSVNLGPGTQVTVRDETGKVIGTGVLAGGKLTPAGCIFTFSARDIPAASFYTFDIAGIPGQPVAAALIIAASWHVDLTLGG